MGKLRDELKEVRFHCRSCDRRFERAPDRVEDAPDEPFHPWRYYAHCTCGADAEQEANQRGLLKAWAHATGPKTPEGRERALQNLEGHPTAEEAQRTRFNALKHGMHARTATYWPAKPGGYPSCQDCQCTAKDVACPQRMELYFRHHVAFTTGDTGMLTELNADLHANLRAIINLMILDVIKDGATVRAPAWYYDKDGGFHLAQPTGEGDEYDEDSAPIMELTAHPMLKMIGEWVSKLGLSLSDMNMTPKVQADEAEARGYLDDRKQSRESLDRFLAAQHSQIDMLRDMIDRSRDAAKRDPVLIEHAQQGGEDG